VRFAPRPCHVVGSCTSAFRRVAFSGTDSRPVIELSTRKLPEDAGVDQGAPSLTRRIVTERARCLRVLGGRQAAHGGNRAGVDGYLVPTRRRWLVRQARDEPPVRGTRCGTTSKGGLVLDDAHRNARPGGQPHPLSELSVKGFIPLDRTLTAFPTAVLLQRSRRLRHGGAHCPPSLNVN
jgi:hypothetical protein